MPRCTGARPRSMRVFCCGICLRHCRRHGSREGGGRAGAALPASPPHAHMGAVPRHVHLWRPGRHQHPSRQAQEAASEEHGRVHSRRGRTCVALGAPCMLLKPKWTQQNHTQCTCTGASVCICSMVGFVHRDEWFASESSIFKPAAASVLPPSSHTSRPVTFILEHST